MRLAELMGVSFASVNRWENGQSHPTTLAWKQILKAEEIGLAAFDHRSPLTDNGKTHKIFKEIGAEFEFSADPEIVRLVAEGERLAYGHLFNPTFATELSLIEPLPHQRIAVYDRMLSEPRLRFLLADDAGAGKTIMSGLYIREMLTRRLIRRVLVVSPAGLVGNWEREMRTLFSLGFRIVSGSDARSGNPFVGSESNLLIISLDTLHGERMFSRLQETSVEPYDLVVFDEAHKLAANRDSDLRIRKTDRYKLAEALAGVRDIEPEWRLSWSCRHLLLLTATPHMGKDLPYYYLWRLLDPDVFSTPDAFRNYPREARSHHFIRRTKEEMVHLDGRPIYPKRISDTHSYDLKQGEVSEQALYDEVTHYIQTYYNQTGALNRSSVRLAMSVFQRRMASSSYALFKSLQNRLKKLEDMILKIRTGEMTIEKLAERQRKLDADFQQDFFEAKTGDEETATDDQEENEEVHDRLMEVVVAQTLVQLQTEKEEVERLLSLAQKVHDLGEESKFESLRDLIRDPRYKDEKFIIFTEFRDTLDFLVRRLEGLGYSGKVAQIHGGMKFKDREDQVDFFKKPNSDGGANYLVATDAAGEGINLQFCWMSINYDIPWNPARLEQRMGRIHRFGQKHDPVMIFNLIAGNTREGHVLKTLLDKLECMRDELHSDKVFDVIGRIFEGTSLAAYMENSLTEEGAKRSAQEVDSKLSGDAVKAIEREEKEIYGEQGDIRKELPRLREVMEQEVYFKLLPGYVRRFIEKASPRIDLQIEGNPDEIFALKEIKRGAINPLVSAFDYYEPQQIDRFTTRRPEESKSAIFLRPGDPFFEQFRSYVCDRFMKEALKGAVFTDPAATKPYLFHLALISVKRIADASISELADEDVLEFRLVGLKQDESGDVLEFPVESLLFLKGIGQIPPASVKLAALAKELSKVAEGYLLDRVAKRRANELRALRLETLTFREEFIAKGYDYQEADLAARRSRYAEKVRSGVPQSAAELDYIKGQQQLIVTQREKTLTVLRREPELIEPGDIKFLAHALIVPSDDPEDKKRYDAEIEALAVKFVWAFEEERGARVTDVSKPPLALAAGLQEDPGFDLLSESDSEARRCIEVKGRARIGDVELTENEWSKSCNLRDRYWLYVVYDCATSNPRLLRIQDPFSRLLFKTKSHVIINEDDIFKAAEGG